MSEPKSDLLIRVEIYELQNAFLPGSASVSPFVRVRVYDQEKETPHRDDSSSCSFNYFFSFYESLTLEDVRNGHIEIEVLARHVIEAPTSLGRIVFAVSKILDSPRNFFPKAWMPICKPEDPTAYRGSLRVSCGVFRKDDVRPKTVTDASWFDGTWTSRLAQSPSFENYRFAILSFYVIKADQLAPALFAEGVKPYIAVRFGGMVLRTTALGNSSSLTWNEELKFPVSYPSLSEQILIELHTEGVQGRICYVETQLTPILRGGLPPTWVDFYSSNASLAMPDYIGSDSRSWMYLGRLLISASHQRQQDPLAGVYPMSTSIVEPVMRQYALWVDMFETCFDLDQLPKEAAVSLQVGNQHIAISSVTRNKNKQFIWSTKGRADKILYLPVTGGNEVPRFQDLVFYIHYRYSQGSWQSYGFRRIELTSIMGTESEVIPIWRNSRSVEPPYEEKGCFLAALQLVPMDGQSTVERAEKPEYEVEQYQFRAKLYDANNVPYTANGLPFPAVRISLGSFRLDSCSMPRTVIPAWDEEIGCTVYLPKDKGLKPDLRVCLLDQMKYDIKSTTLARLSLRGDSFTKPADGPSSFSCPVETSLHSAQNFIHLLASFEILPVHLTNSVMRFPSPDKTLCTIRIFLLGVRSGDASLANVTPRLRLTFGRHPLTKEPLWQQWSAVGEKATDGHYNFLEEMTFEAMIPSDPMFHAGLEIEVADTQPKFELFDFGEASGLTQMSEEVAKITEGIGTGLNDMWNFFAFGEDASPTQASTRTPAERTQQELGETDVEMGPNVLKSPYGTHASLSDWETTTLPVGWSSICLNEHWSSKKRNMGGNELPIGDAFRGAPLNSMPTDGRSSAVSSHAGGADDAAGDKHQSRSILIHKDQRFVDIKRPVEEGIRSTIPYNTVSVVGVDAKSVGVLKYACLVEDNSDDSAEAVRERNMFSSSMQEIVTMYESSKAESSVVNVYMLQGESIVGQNPVQDTDVYLWLSFPGSKLNTKYNVKDDYNCRKITPDPEFNKVYVFDGVCFPEHSTLEVRMMNMAAEAMVVMGSPQETEIGLTRIDLEDRWMSSRYAEIMARESADSPILVETRHLYKDNLSVASCTMKMWVEVMNREHQSKYPRVNLTSGVAKRYQVQVCVYKVKILDASPDATMHLYVTGSMTSAEGIVQTETTSTHYGESSGRGTFNWRFVFDTTIPCPNSILAFKVWDGSVMTGGYSDEPYADALIDLETDFDALRESEMRGEGYPEVPPRGWIEMTHAVHGVRAQLDISIRIQNEEDFTANPVGRGREHPNKDPYLDENDPHMLSHESYIANNALVTAASGVWDATKGPLCSVCSFALLVGLFILLWKVGALSGCGNKSVPEPNSPSPPTGRKSAVQENTALQGTK